MKGSTFLFPNSSIIELASECLQQRNGYAGYQRIVENGEAETLARVSSEDPALSVSRLSFTTRDIYEKLHIEWIGRWEARDD